MTDDNRTFDGRKVYLPLAEMAFCHACQKSAKDVKLRQCKACGEALYCSRACQKRDWKNHKVQCGETDRINLDSYYPFLAGIAHIVHAHPAIIRHPALERHILNLEEFPIVTLPNGISTRLVFLANKMSDRLATIGSRDWWPGAPSEEIRHKVLHRIGNEGFLLPKLLSICVALVLEMYTTTAWKPDDKDSDIYQVTGKRRVRLTYNHSPIADFGIVQGSVCVTDKDRLAYYIVDEGRFHLGRNPDEHYRIYIKTLAGEEYHLDLGMYTFNFCYMVDTPSYFVVGDIGPVPAYFTGDYHAKTLPEPGSFKPRRRVSVLRDARVHEIARPWGTKYCDCDDTPNVLSIMDDIAGKKCSQDEKKMVMHFLTIAVQILRSNMAKRQYMNFPEKFLVIPDLAPGEYEDRTPEDDAKYEQGHKYLVKLANKLKKGKISQKEWEKAFNEFERGNWTDPRAL